MYSCKIKRGKDGWFWEAFIDGVSKYKAKQCFETWEEANHNAYVCGVKMHEENPHDELAKFIKEAVPEKLDTSEATYINLQGIKDRL